MDIVPGYHVYRGSEDGEGTWGDQQGWNIHSLTYSNSWKISYSLATAGGESWFFVASPISETSGGPNFEPTQPILFTIEMLENGAESNDAHATYMGFEHRSKQLIEATCNKTLGRYKSAQMRVSQAIGDPKHGWFITLSGEYCMIWDPRFWESTKWRTAFVCRVANFVRQILLNNSMLRLMHQLRGSGSHEFQHT